jgi:hypothetical protein
MNTKETKDLTVKDGTDILACTAIMGAKRGCGWHYSWYTAKASTKSGYVYKYDATYGMYPNKANYAWDLKYREEMRTAGYIIVDGRPHRKVNAPEVIS